MANVVLKDCLKNIKTYKGVETVKVQVEDGTIQAYSKGIAVDKEDPILLNFLNDTQTVFADDGTLMKSVVIKKPETLLPENIREGINIAGVDGEYTYDGPIEGTVSLTFANYDSAILFSRYIYAGDDSYDPVLQGKIEIPTKEDTDANVFTFCGWSDTIDGNADESVLDNITEDTVVYAVYVAEDKYYIVRFYDGATLMQESQVAYGEKAIPPSTHKSGHYFKSWTPNDFTIYGNTDFYGTWVEGDVFEEQTLTFAYANSFKAYRAEVAVESLINVGETYHVVWDGVDYTCTAANIEFSVDSGFVKVMTIPNAIGSPSNVGAIFGNPTTGATNKDTGEEIIDANEPFFINYSSNKLYFTTQDDSTTHTVRIYC